MTPGSDSPAEIKRLIEQLEFDLGLTDYIENFERRRSERARIKGLINHQKRRLAETRHPV